jgi:hypothetical protein
MFLDMKMAIKKKWSIHTGIVLDIF